MPMKDRLEELHAKRELLEADKGGKKSKSESNSKMSGGQNLQNFLSEVGKIESDLTKMKEDVAALKKLQQDMLSTPFCEKSSVVKYESMGEEIRHSATKIGGALKQLEKKYSEKDIEGDTTLLRVRTQQMNTLSTELNLATNDFFKTQSHYMDKMKSRLRRQLSARGDSVADDSKIGEILDQDSYSVFTENYAMDVQNAEQTLRDLEDRKSDILKLEKGVSEVNQLFKDLNLMVADQGETITTIEQAVDDTAVHVEGGKGHLKKAREHQSRARRRKMWICGIVLVALIVLGIILAIIFTSD